MKVGSYESFFNDNILYCLRSSSRMRTARLPTVPVLMATTRCQYWGIDRPPWDTYQPWIPIPLIPQKGPGTRYTYPPPKGTREQKNSMIPPEGAWDRYTYTPPPQPPVDTVTDTFL